MQANSRLHGPREMVAVLVLGLCALAWLVPAGDATAAPSAHASSTPPLGGVNIVGVGPGSLREADQAISQARALHAKVVRTTVSWSVMEPNAPGQIEPRTLAFADRLVSDAAAAGIRVIMLVDSSPCWASSAPSSLLRRCVSGRMSSANAWPPSNPATYAAFVAFLAQRYGASLADASHLWLQILRILCMALDTFCFYYATRTMPLADVMTFYMATPLFLTALSVPLLGEKVESFRWVAVAVGFVGVVIALQPSRAMLSSASPLALLGAAMFALSQTVTRKLRGVHWLHLVVWQFVGAGVIGAATLPWFWVTPTWLDLGLLFLLGIVAMLCFVCLTRALAMTPTAVLAPFQYTMLLWATIMGWIVWRDAPSPPILIGSAIIIGSGLFVIYRDREPSIAVPE